MIGAGDFASVHRGLEETIAALAGIRPPTLLVPGNNETDAALREACADWPADGSSTATARRWTAPRSSGSAPACR